MSQQGQGTSTRREEIMKVVKFAIMGGLATLVELAVFYFLQNVVFVGLRTQGVQFLFMHFEGLGYLWSYLISTTIGYAIAFVLNRKLTFHADANPVLSVVLYVLMVIFTILATTWLGMWLMQLFVANDMRSLGEVIVKPMVALSAIVWTYPINRFVIHRKRKADGPATK